MALTNPVPSGRFTDPFGDRGWVPGLGWLGFHTGRDIAANTGIPILAAHNGTVTAKWYDRFADGSGAGGWMVKIQGDDGLETRYAHMTAESPLPVGARVVQGRTVVGFVGSSGAATGPHLHFEVLENGVFVNPDPYITATPTPPTPAPPATQRKRSMATVYCTTSNNKRPGKGGVNPSYFLAGDSPGTEANWIPTVDVALATEWAAAHGNAVWLTKASASDFKRQYTQPLKMVAAK